MIDTESHLRSVYPGAQTKGKGDLMGIPLIISQSKKGHCRASHRSDIKTAQTITEAKRALHAIKFIKPHFHQDELRQRLTSNFFSILYYNSEIWHIPSLNANLKQQLLTASAASLRLCTSGDAHTISYLDLHKLN